MIRDGLRFCGALFAVALIGWTAFTLVSLVAQDQQSLADRAALREELTEEQAAREALTQQVESLGETPVVAPPKSDVKSKPSNRYVPVPGPAGKDGEDGTNGANGKSLPGLPGAPGQSIVGPPGATGKDGATGPAGPAGSAGKDGKDGSPGADGAPGSNGADGRGITSLACSGAVAPITFTVTFSDGSSQDFSCGPAVEPEPTP